MSRASQPSLRRARQGLTLIELLVASVLLGTVLLVLVQGVGLATRVASQAHRETLALELLRSLSAQLRGGLLPVTDAIQGDFSEEGYADIRWAMATEVYGDDEDKLHRCTLTIYWPEAGGERSLTVAGVYRDPSQDEDEDEEETE